MSKCKILIAYHKPAKLIKSDIYVPIQVGKDISIEKSKDGKLSSREMDWMNKNLIGDNTGDNISKLNRYYNEMSAVYWAWKNQTTLENPEFIGLMHYRRHFIFSESNYSKYTWLPKSNVYSYEFMDNKYKNLINEKYIQKLINRYDIIASHKYNANNLNDGHYYRNCKERFLEVAKCDMKWYEKMENIIHNYYPEYDNEIKQLAKEPTHYLCNMFVMKKDIFDKYCEFTFNILDKIFDEFKSENTNMWQTRAIGFLAEFLTSVFISHYKSLNSDKVKELDLTYIEKPELCNIFQKICRFIISKRINYEYQFVTILKLIKYKKRLRKNNELNYIKQQNEHIIKLIEDKL